MGNHFRWFCIFEDFKKKIRRVSKSNNSKDKFEHISYKTVEEEMNVNQIACISELEGVRRIEINLERVAIWTLVFTNSFFVSYFFAKLFNLI